MRIFEASRRARVGLVGQRVSRMPGGLGQGIIYSELVRGGGLCFRGSKRSV